ncbi:MAG TPA: glycosyltransferase [Thermoanaerobaculia bacterium]|nr:glycosyltransferase [Thermoanaerobaculia bacterium]
MSGSFEACVVINALNEAPRIGRQLDALSAQAGDVRFEVLVADNGSTDGTPDVVRDYARRHPSFPLSVCHEPRKGVALALRRGLDVAAARGRPA